MRIDSLAAVQLARLLGDDLSQRENASTCV